MFVDSKPSLVQLRWRSLPKLNVNRNKSLLNVKIHKKVHLRHHYVQRFAQTFSNILILNFVMNKWYVQDI